MARNQDGDLGDPEAWVVDVVEIGHGVTQFQLFTPRTVGPVGVVWVFLAATQSGRKRATAMVLNSWVSETWRRRGIRTRLNQEILEHADAIVTASGSKGGGRAFMKASGYTLDGNRTGLWFHRPRR